MHRIHLVRCSIRYGDALSTIPPFSASQCSHASLSHHGQKKGNKQRQRKRSTTRRRHGNRDRMESMQDWVEQDSSSTKESNSETQETPRQYPSKRRNSDLPLEVWAEHKSDPTFFHGQKGLGLEWTAPSVHTSQHASVKAILKEIQSKAPNVQSKAPVARHIVEDGVDWSDETNDTEEDEESDWH